MILLECPQTGEQCVVESAEGYDGWRVIAETVPPSPGDHYRWVVHEGRWRMDVEAALRAEDFAAVTDREQLVALIRHLFAEIEDLKGRLP